MKFFQLPWGVLGNLFSQSPEHARKNFLKAWIRGIKIAYVSPASPSSVRIHKKELSPFSSFYQSFPLSMKNHANLIPSSYSNALWNIVLYSFSIWSNFCLYSSNIFWFFFYQSHLQLVSGTLMAHLFFSVWLWGSSSLKNTWLHQVWISLNFCGVYFVCLLACLL